MSLPAGTKLGTYEVVAPIRAGGMGEVYQAHDTKLGRDMAIKVLPEAFAHDPERLSRFQREAKMLAQLNHPVLIGDRIRLIRIQANEANKCRVCRRDTCLSQEPRKK